MMKHILAIAVTLGAAVTLTAAQSPSRPSSPSATASTQVGGEWVKGQRGQRYQGGKWIDLTYSGPIKRGRTTLCGSGADYGKTLLGGAPVWRAGADVSTRLKTEAALQIGGKTVAPGEYSLFIDLKSPTDWTLIVSSWGAQKTYDDKNKAELWGSYNYTPDKDVARVAMKVDKLPMSVDQLAWSFADVTAAGGTLVLMWDTVVAAAPFTLAAQ